MPDSRAFVAILLFLSLIRFSIAAEEPVAIGSDVQLLVDKSLIESMDGTELRMHPPVRREVVFTFDAPWEGQQSGYVTYLKDGAQYRMYYRGGGDITEEVTCVAFSDDGVHWARPTLGLFEFNGSKENNILWKGRERGYWESHNFTPFLDENPAAKPEERYKAVALGRYDDEKGDRRKMLVALFSPDGIHWNRKEDVPIIRDGSFDSQNVAFWDTARREYVCYSRIGRNGFRSIQRSTSKDFEHWSEGTPLEFGGTPLEQLYTNAIQACPENPNLYLGFPMRFVPERKTVGADERKTDGVSDGVMMSSRDGLNFNRPFMEGYIRPGLDGANWGQAHGNNCPAWGLLSLSDDEISLYWAEHYITTPQMRRGTVRRDGFASVHAPYEGGEFVTRPLVFTGNTLILNLVTSAVGSVQVEVQDPDGKPIQGFELAQMDPVYGDELARPASWNSGADLGTLAGKPVRFRFAMKDADLYAYRVK